jgi:hypothetical protein
MGLSVTEVGCGCGCYGAVDRASALILAFIGLILPWQVPRSQEDKPSYPWDKFMNTMAQQAGEAAATAAVASLSQQATQAVAGTASGQATTASSKRKQRPCPSRFCTVTEVCVAALSGSVPADVLGANDNPFALE